MRVLGRGAAPLLAALRHVTGVDLISDLTTFFGLLGDMTEDFSERAAAVEQMLKAPTSAFVLVTSAQAPAIDEAIWFRRTLQESGLPFAGVIVNRVHHDLLGDAAPADVVGRAGRPARPTISPPEWPPTSTTTTCSPGATGATWRGWPELSSATALGCSSPTSTTTCTTSRACCASTATCSPPTPSASG